MTEEAGTGTATAPSREAIRAELEETRTRYMALLDSLSAEDWGKKSANRSWSVRQLMWHMPWGNSYIPRGVADCIKGKGFNPPQGIADFVNTWITRFGSRGATPEAVREKYEAAHKGILACLDAVKDEDWSKGTKVFNQEETVESVLRSGTRHFEEHDADIRKGLGRA